MRRYQGNLLKEIMASIEKNESNFKRFPQLHDYQIRAMAMVYTPLRPFGVEKVIGYEKT
ncbi:hypothetical protein ACJROX_18850 [Pseudalkalibacillus sp. A8]|uniref:hypothetical protein n=1 Tax=Pseudalkalibacillus sp. A8 TaxID=3382641 RepID=UPI0038B651B7